jgi:hypothetical protein
MMQSNSTDSKPLAYQKELHISWKKPEGGEKLIILKLNDGDFFSLEDPVSIKIWEQLMAGDNPAIIVENLKQRCPGTDPSVIARDVEEFIAKLVGNRLICPCPRDGATV